MSSEAKLENQGHGDAMSFSLSMFSNRNFFKILLKSGMLTVVLVSRVEIYLMN